MLQVLIIGANMLALYTGGMYGIVATGVITVVCLLIAANQK